MVNDDDVAAIKACKKWCGYQRQANYSNMVEFAKYLGDPLVNEDGKTIRPKIVNMENPEVKRKVELINGPYGDAILAMMKAQNETD